MAEGLQMYGSDGIFPLQRERLQLLDAAFFGFAENGVSGGVHSGTDGTGRGIMQLMAEALSGHDLGVEHLLWRSKQFSVGGQQVDP